MAITPLGSTLKVPSRLAIQIFQVASFCDMYLFVAILNYTLLGTSYLFSIRPIRHWNCAMQKKCIHSTRFCWRLVKARFHVSPGRQQRPTSPVPPHTSSSSSSPRSSCWPGGSWRRRWAPGRRWVWRSYVCLARPWTCRRKGWHEGVSLDCLERKGGRVTSQIALWCSGGSVCTVQWWQPSPCLPNELPRGNDLQPVLYSCV